MKVADSGVLCVNGLLVSSDSMLFGNLQLRAQWPGRPLKTNVRAAPGRNRGHFNCVAEPTVSPLQADVPGEKGMLAARVLEIRRPA